MFRGSAIAKIDAKGRLKVPTDFRRVLEESWGKQVFLTSVQGDAGLLYPLPVWEQMEARLLGLPANDPIRKRYLERVSYFGQEGELDSQGRLVISATLRQRAALDGEIVVCGSVDHLEIWSHERFLARLDERPFTDEDYEVLASRGV